MKSFLTLTLLVVFALSATAIEPDSTKCQDLLTSELALGVNSPVWQKIFRYSGHWLSQLGSYHQCLREKDYTYLLMHIVPDINIFGLFFDVGFCLPDVCANKNFDTIAFIDSALS